MGSNPTRLAYTVATPDCRGPIEFGHEAPFEQAVEELGDLGYDGLELQVRDPSALRVDYLRSLLDGAGLQVAALATGPLASEGFGLCHHDPAVREGAVSRVKELIGVAAQLQTVVSLGRILDSDRNGAATAPELRMKSTATALQDLAAHAEECNVRLLIEPQNRHLTDLVNTIGDARKLLEDVGSPNLGILADTYHLALAEASPEAALMEAGSAVEHVQFSDTNRGRPGTGAINFGSVLRVLELLGYQGWVTMEHRQDASRDTARRALQFFRSID